MMAAHYCQVNSLSTVDPLRVTAVDFLWSHTVTSVNEESTSGRFIGREDKILIHM